MRKVAQVLVETPTVSLQIAIAQWPREQLTERQAGRAAAHHMAMRFSQKTGSWTPSRGASTKTKESGMNSDPKFEADTGDGQHLPSWGATAITLVRQREAGDTLTDYSTEPATKQGKRQPRRRRSS